MSSLGTYKISVSPEAGDFKGLGKKIARDLQDAIKDINLPDAAAGGAGGATGAAAGMAGLGKNLGNALGNSVLSSVSSLALEIPKMLYGLAGNILTGVTNFLPTPAKLAFEGLVQVSKFTFTAIAEGAKVAGVAIAAGIGVAIKEAITNTAEWEQNIGGLEAVFGDNAGAMVKWAKTLANSAGLSVNEAASAATQIGQILKAQGFSQEDALNNTQKLIQRASDAASVLGISTSEALMSLTSGLKGNIEVLDNIGAPLTMAMLGEFALSKGITESTSKMDAQTKAMLINQYILEKTASFAGNFADESLTLAGSLSILKASWVNLTSLLAGGEGGDFEGALKSMIAALQNFAESITKHVPLIIKGVGEAFAQLLPTLIATISTMFGSLFKALGEALTRVMDVLFSEFKFNDKTFGNFFLFIIDGLYNGFVNAMGYIAKNVDVFSERLMSFLPTLGLKVRDGLISMLGVVGQVILPELADIIGRLAPGFAEGFVMVFRNLIALAPQIANILVNLISTLVPYINEALDILYGTLFVQVLPTISESLTNSILSVAKQFVAIFQIVLPYLYEALDGIVTQLMADDELVTLLAGYIKSIFEKLEPLVEPLLPIIGMLLTQAVGYMLVGIIEGITTLLGRILASLGVVILGILGAVGEILGTGVGYILDGFINGWDKAGENFKKNWVQFWETIVLLWKAVWGIHSPSTVARDIGIYLIEGLINGVSGMWTKFSDWMGGLFNSFITFFSGFGQSFYNIGVNIVTGLINGIVSMATNFGSSVKDLGTDVIKGLAKVLGIHSPSRVMRDFIGKNIVLGIHEGITNNAKMLSDDMVDIADSIVTDFGEMGVNGELSAQYYNFDVTVPTPKSNRQSINAMQEGTVSGIKKAKITL